MKKHHLITLGLFCLGIITGKAQCTLGVNIITVSNASCTGQTGTLTAASGADSVGWVGSINLSSSNTGSPNRFVVPPGVTTLTLTVAGAQGGGSVLYPLMGQGGFGAIVKGVCNVIPGHVLLCIAGGEGGNGFLNYEGGSYEETVGSGGGGGSFVYDSNTTTLLAVGGGGGGSGSDEDNLITGSTNYVSWVGGFTDYDTYGGNGGTDIVTNSCTNGTTGSNAFGGSGGNGGSCGILGAGSSTYAKDIYGMSVNTGNTTFPIVIPTVGGSGAGWNSNGNHLPPPPLFSGTVGYAKDRVNGFDGEAPANINMNNQGGYGGGGGGGSYAGGGGGGYNGGGGGNEEYLSDEAQVDISANEHSNGFFIPTGGGSGGGGSSYLNGVAVGTPVATEKGSGYVSIQYHSQGSISGGTSPYTYSWSPTGGNGATATGLSAGTYTLTVTDNQGCSITASASITQTSSLGITISSVTNASCNNPGSATATLNLNSSVNKVFSFQGVVQNWVVPSGITTITVSVTGAQGGTMVDSSSFFVGIGGKGASLTGICTVTPGHNLSIVVGQQGMGSLGFNGNGGGGGSFVYDSNSITLLAVGGGGGGGNELGLGGANSFGGNGGTNIITNAPTSSPGGSATGGTGGNGGSSGSDAAGGGAGWISNGISDSIGAGGKCRTSQFLGGYFLPTSLFYAPGGYGGGGTSGANNYAAGGGFGGGGGGYNGGGGGNRASGGGGGGGSYLNGTVIGTPVANQSGNGSASISYSILGGASPYTYSWSGGGGTNLTATGLSGGTYTITVTDKNGCQATAATTITATPSLNIIATNLLCNGGTNGADTVIASGGISPYTYSWSNGQTSSIASGLTAGTYSVSVTDAHGCSTSSSSTITQPPALTVTVSATNLFCYGGTHGTAAAIASGGTGAYTYSWSNGQASSGITGLTAGTYSVTITDAHGCSTSSSTTLTQPAALYITGISETNVSCNGGNNGSATVGNTGDTYLWSDGQTTSTASGLAAGTYTVKVTDGCNASATASAIITQPAALSINITETNIGCNGGNYGSISAFASGGTGAYTYSWSNSVGTNPTATGLSTGIYTITVNDNNGCSATSSATITQPAALGVTLSSVTNVLCYGTDAGAVTANAATGGTPPYTYSWSPRGGNSLETVTSLNAGTYTITVTDNSGCSAMASATITQPLSSIQVTLSSVTNVSCFGGIGNAIVNAASGGISPYTYFWIPGGGNNLTATLSVGTYTLQAVDNNGCSALAYATITQPDPLTASGFTSINVNCNGGNNGSGSVSASGGTPPYTYSWSNNVTINSSSGLSAGSYSVTITDANLCSTTASIIITQPTIFITSGVSSGNIFCNGGNGGSGSISTTGGTPPYTYSWSNSSTTSSVSGLQSGSYNVTITDNNECFTTTVITITQPAALGVTILSVNNISCPGGTGTIIANSATGGVAPYTYSWSGGAGINLSATVSAGTYTLTVTDLNGCIATVSCSISQPAALGITIANVSNANCNGASGSITANAATGGTIPYTYSWNGLLQPNLRATNLVAGTYTVTVVDNNGCTATASATLTQPTSLDISIVSESNVNCSGGTGSIRANVAIGGTSPYTYTWEPSGGNGLTAIVSAGSYTIIVIDNSGCTALASASITQPVLALGITLSSQTTMLCNGGTAIVTANVATGGTSPYTYSWNSGGGTNLSARLSAGTFTITVTDSHGCTSTTSAIISQPNILTVSGSSSTNVSCNGGNNGSGSLSVTGGIPAYTYSWSNGNTKSSISGLSAGTYSVTVTDLHGCSIVSGLTITQPAAISLTTRVVNINACQINTGSATLIVTGGTSPYTYRWSNAKTNSSITGLSAGTYTVTVTDSHGCTVTTSAIITKASALTATKSASNVTCYGNDNGSASVNIGGGASPYTYRWSNAKTTSSVTGLSAGTYSLTVTDASGCTLTESVTITQPARALSASGNVLSDISCNGGNSGSAEGIASGGTSPYTYSWSNNKTSSATTGLSAGIYTCTIIDFHGCSATARVAITQPNDLRDSISAGSCVRNLITASLGIKGGLSPYTYSWSPTGKTTATATGLSAGTYTITIHDNHDCSATLVAKLSCGNVDSPVKDTDNSSSVNCCLGGMENVNLYPNPNTGQFTIAGIEKGMIIELYDYTGRKISEISANEETVYLNISNQSNGLYLIRIIDKDGNLVSEKKVVKTR